MYKINILPSTWDYFIKIHAINKKNVDLFLQKLRHFDSGLNNR